MLSTTKIYTVTDCSKVFLPLEILEEKKDNLRHLLHQWFFCKCVKFGFHSINDFSFNSTNGLLQDNSPRLRTMPHFIRCHNTSVNKFDLTTPVIRNELFWYVVGTKIPRCARRHQLQPTSFIQDTESQEFDMWGTSLCTLRNKSWKIQKCTPKLELHVKSGYLIAHFPGLIITVRYGSWVRS